MSLLKRLFGPKPRLLAAEAERLRAWRARPGPNLLQPFAEARYVVVDVESSGLNLAKDRLIAIGAVAVKKGRIVVGDSFEVILKQDVASDHSNILIHGIGGTAQREGVEPSRALLDFLDYLDGAPLVAFHVAFDETMIKRAVREYLGFTFSYPWLDLAYVSPALCPSLASRLRALDDWTRQFGIGNFARHSALADALATAQLLQVMLDKAERSKFMHYGHLLDREHAQRLTRWS